MDKGVFQLLNYLGDGGISTEETRKAAWQNLLDRIEYTETTGLAHETAAIAEGQMGVMVNPQAALANASLYIPKPGFSLSGVGSAIGNFFGSIFGGVLDGSGIKKFIPIIAIGAVVILLILVKK